METHRSTWLELLKRVPRRNTGRYAPSPTGTQHMGNLQTAYAAFMQTQKQRATFILRIEDVDLGRVVEGSTEGILRDLRRLGITWDEGPDIGGKCGPYIQSERFEFYTIALEFLQQKNLIFPCYCSRKEIREAASPVPGQTLVYPGTCRNLSQEERFEKAKTKTPSLRFRVPDRVISYRDKVCGTFTQDLQFEVGDFILKRADGCYSYQHAVVVDDILMGITDVIRGEDLLDSTPRQIALFEALQADALPRFWHVPLLMESEGKKMSKRYQSEGLEAFIKTSNAPDPIANLRAFFEENLRDIRF